MTVRQQRSQIQRSVEQLLQLANITEPPIPVERLARLRGAQLRYVPFEGALSGLLYKEGDQIVIGINSLHSKTRQRFTIAHELGHLERHSDHVLYVDRNFPVRLRDERSSEAVDPEEIAANAFAAELLMPTKMLKQDIQGLTVDYEEDELVRGLADRYKVSLQAMIFRLTNLNVIEAL